MPKINRVILDHTIEFTPPPEPQAEFSIAETSYVGDENTVITFRINRTVRTDQVCDIDWAVTNATVTPASGTQRFQIGESFKDISVTAGEIDTNELGSLDISNPVLISGTPSSPILGSPISATFRVNDTAQASTFINARNVWGGVMVSGANQMFDPATDQYTWARCANFVVSQLRTLGSAGRDSHAQQYLDLNTDNPLLFVAFHMSHFTNWPAYEKKVGSNWDAYLYKYLNQNDRRKVIVHYDSDNWASQINGNKNPVSGFSQTGVTANIYDPGVQDWSSSAAVDTLVGSTLSDTPGPGIPGAGVGADISDFSGWFNDNMAMHQFISQVKLELTQAFGEIDAITYTGPSNTHVNTVDIDSDPGSGVIGESIFFFPSTNTNFIGYEIGGYQSLGGGKARLTMKALPSTAQTEQDYVPTAAHRYSICNSGNQTNQGDWNYDGAPTSEPISANQWIPGLLNYRDQIHSKMLIETGHESGYGINGINGSLQRKEETGWQTPCQYNGAFDYPLYENAASDIGWQGNTSSEAQGYPVGSFKGPTYMLRALNWAASWVGSPNSFMSDKARGVAIEPFVWGNYSSAHTALDATYLRLWWALCVLIPDVQCQPKARSGGSDSPMAIEEFWLDLDTNWFDQESLGTYLEDDTSIPDGSSGPKHSFTFATPDAGEAIYIRRVGSFVIAINLADFPSGYPSNYSPSHLSGYSPRTTDDEITPSDFNALDGKGILQSTENIRHLDFAAGYINQRITTWLQSERPTVWGSSAPGGPYNYGPRETHPADSVATISVANAVWKIEDDVMNGGVWSVNGQQQGGNVNRSISYFLGPMEAVCWEVY